jgi:hypothetical protein
MAGTSWDKLGLMDTAFELVAPALRRVALAEGVKLHEFFRDDPLWRLDFARQAGGEAVVDVAWHEDRPEEYRVTASWWLDDYDTTLRRSRQEDVGTFTRDRSLEELESMLRDALNRIDGWTESDLDQQSGPHPDWHRYQSREDFYRTRLPRR